MLGALSVARGCVHPFPPGTVHAAWGGGGGVLGHRTLREGRETPAASEQRWARGFCAGRAHAGGERGVISTAVSWLHPLG